MNRLHKEDSPYLQQHKDNPVHWFAWSDEAFEKAKNEHKPIFISVGYSSCHWCHVMEHESFENERIAAQLNEHFVCIKVDKEERPDIDKHYQHLYQLLNRRAGGWPCSVFCTPDNRPIFAGTYLPPFNRDRMMGLYELCEIIAKKVGEQDKDLLKNADEIQRFLHTKPAQSSHVVLCQTHIKKFILTAKESYDKHFGGFSEAPKFPMVSTLDSLLDFYLLMNDDELRKMLEYTLTSMSRGGMYDIVEGGFCRYSVDEMWLVPHFEKMTYDNALLCALYARAAECFENEHFKHVALSCANFMCDTMSENHLFYSASDADTEGVEGKYFVYDYKETLLFFEKNGFETEEAKKTLNALGITSSGNFEGNSIAWFEEEICDENTTRALALLKQMRMSRTYPFIDKKVLTSWNAMMIQSLFELSGSYLNQAKMSLDALMHKHFLEGELYHVSLIDKPPKVKAFLEDYAYLCSALISAHQHTFEAHYLSVAQQLANLALEQFYRKGKWLFSTGSFTTEADIFDSSYPGSAGIMCEVLFKLGILCDMKYTYFAKESVMFYSANISKNPFYMPTLFKASTKLHNELLCIKSNVENLKALSLNNPYIVILPSDDKEYLVCGSDSCFASCKTVQEVAKVTASMIESRLH